MLQKANSAGILKSMSKGNHKDGKVVEYREITHSKTGKKFKRKVYVNAPKAKPKATKKSLTNKLSIVQQDSLYELHEYLSEEVELPFELPLSHPDQVKVEFESEQIANEINWDALSAIEGVSEGTTGDLVIHSASAYQTVLEYVKKAGDELGYCIDTTQLVAKKRELTFQMLTDRDMLTGNISDPSILHALKKHFNKSDDIDTEIEELATYVSQTGSVDIDYGVDTYLFEAAVLEWLDSKTFDSDDVGELDDSDWFTEEEQEWESILDQAEDSWDDYL